MPQNLAPISTSTGASWPQSPDQPGWYDAYDPNAPPGTAPAPGYAPAAAQQPFQQSQTWPNPQSWQSDRPSDGAPAADVAALRAELARVNAEAELARARAAAELAALREAAERAQLEATIARAGEASPRTLSKPQQRGSQRARAPPSAVQWRDDVADGERDDDGVSAVFSEGGTRKLPALSSATAKALRAMGTLAPTSVPRFVRLFKQRVARNDPLIRELLDAGTPGGDDELMAADEWLAGTLLDCLDGESTHVANYTEALTDAELESGTAMLRVIEERNALRVGAQRRVAEDDFKQYRPFKQGMAAEDVEAAANELIARFKRLARYDPKDLLAIRLMLIKKMPEGKARDDLEDDLYEADIAAKSDAERAVKPWSTIELVQLIALKLRAKARAHAAEQQQQQQQQQQRQQQQQQQDIKCQACGVAGHDARACTKRCSSCGIKNCPGTHSGAAACVMASATKPSNILNGRGKKVARVIYDQLLAEHKKRYPAAYAAEHEPSSDDAAAQPPQPAAAAAEVQAALGAAIAPGASAPHLHAHCADACTCMHGMPPPQRRGKRALRRAAKERELAEQAERAAAAAAAEAESRMRAVCERHGIAPFARLLARA